MRGLRRHVRRQLPAPHLLRVQAEGVPARPRRFQLPGTNAAHEISYGLTRHGYNVSTLWGVHPVVVEHF